MKRLFRSTSMHGTLLPHVFAAGLLFVATGFSPAPIEPEDNVKPILLEVEQALVHYRAWLDSPAFASVVKGTNHAARATMLIDAYLLSYKKQMHEQVPQDGRVGLHGIRALLLKQMRIHVDLLSTNVPVGIVTYDSAVENAVEEQLDLLEQTLREFERHQSEG